MPSAREGASDESCTGYNNLCTVVCGTLCIILATLFFFGNVFMAVWFYEHNYPAKFSVICFIVASGVIYLTSFTSSLLLVTKEFPSKKRTLVNSNEESVVGFTQREGTQESYEMTSNISCREDPNLLQLPQKVVARKTPHPPYDNSANGLTTRGSSISVNEIGEAQLTIQTLDDDGLTNRGYYELEENSVYRNGEVGVTQRFINYDAAVQEQTSPTLIASLDKSPSSSNEIKQQRVANSQFLLKAHEQATIDASRNSFRDEQHGFQHASTNPERSLRPAVRVKRITSTTLKRKLNTRMSMSQSDLDSETRKNSPLKSNAEIHSNCNMDGSSQVSQSNYNDQVRTFLSCWTHELTPRFSRRSAEARTSHVNFNPAAIPHTSQSSLNTKNSLVSSNPESEKPKSVSNLNKGRQQFPSRSNWLLPTDRRFVSHSNLNMDSGHQSFASQSNSNSEASHCSSRINTDSDMSPGNSSSNIVEVDTQSHVKNLKEIYQPEQFVARSNDAPSIHKARSFGSLAVNASKSPQMETGNLQNIIDGNASANNHTYVPGRSTESVPDASKRCRKMTLEEWMSAWNHGVRKKPSADAERIVGVRL